MTVESLLESPLIQIVACVCTKREKGNRKKEKKELMDARNRWTRKARLKLDAHVPIKPVHRPKAVDRADLDVLLRLLPVSTTSSKWKIKE
jgi:hypothetical protein